MTEQEKKDVIHALETLAHHKKIGGACELCAKTEEFALELLKEQQAVIDCLERKVKQFENEKSWDECPDRMNGGGWTWE